MSVNGVNSPVKTETFTVRNDRSCYPQDKKPSVDAVLQDALKGGYDKVKTSTYSAFGNEKNIPSTVKTYYAADGSVVAEQVHVHNEADSFHPQEYVVIKTPTANYADWDNDGKVDSKDVDKTYPKSIFENPSKSDAGSALEKSISILNDEMKPSLHHNIEQTKPSNLKSTSFQL